MTLLSSVTSVYQKLRDQVPTSISTGLNDQTLVSFLNEAAAEVLNTHAWSFLKRYDGQAFFPAPFTADAGGSVAQGFFFGHLNVAGANSWSSTDVANFSGPPVLESRTIARMQWEGETLSYRITSFQTGAQFPFVTLDAYRGPGYSSNGWTVYSHEFVLPETVRQVLSVYDQERELKLILEDRDLDQIARQPRDTSAFAPPESAFVGSAATATGNDLGSDPQTGMTLTIYPPPDADLTLKYSYLYRHPRLTADADEWVGVPVEVTNLIEWFAFEKALDSNVEDDPERAARLRVKLEGNLQRLKDVDTGMLLKRYVPREIGERRDSRNPRARWANLTITPP